MKLTPDQIVIFSVGPFAVSATVAFSWIVVAGLAALSYALTRKLPGGMPMSPGQKLLEVLVSGIERQAAEITQEDPRQYLSFVGPLFLFLLASNVLGVVPGFVPPTCSFSTKAALVVCVFCAVPYFGIREQGLRAYLTQYVRPTVLMLPFNLLGELSRTAALAVRLFGSIMNGTLIGALLLAIVPLVFPVFARAAGLLIGVIQAYVFAVIALVFISAASRARAENLMERKR